MKRILVIDGNYMANRALGILNMDDRVNHLNTDNELKQFRNELNRSLISICEAFGDYIDDMIFCSDNKSWRKSVPYFKPYYIDISGDEDAGIGLGYKDNRTELKEKSETNYDNFNMVYDEFREDVKSKIHLLNINKLEGDDLIALISNKIKDRQDLEILLFANDGDMEMVVRNNVFIMRNIKSKEAPHGEYVITMSMYEKYFEMSAMDQLLNSSVAISQYKKLFSLDLYNPQVVVNRELNKGISIATPYKILLKKSICGDKKDNIFPIFRWKSTTGTRNFKVTENHIKKALKRMGLFLTESTCKKLFADKEGKLLEQFIDNLKIVTKQPHTITKNIIDHLKHNIKLNVLSASVMPKESVSLFDDEWKKIEGDIMAGEGKFDIDKLKRSLGNTLQTNAGESVLANSIPDLDSLIES